MVWLDTDLGQLPLTPAPEDAGRMVDIANADALGLTNDVVI